MAAASILIGNKLNGRKTAVLLGFYHLFVTNKGYKGEIRAGGGSSVNFYRK